VVRVVQTGPPALFAFPLPLLTHTSWQTEFGRWFKSGLRNHKCCSNRCPISRNHPILYFSHLLLHKSAQTPLSGRYSMSSSFFSPDSNTESMGRGVKQNRPGQQNSRSCPVQESTSKWIASEWLVIRPGSMPSAEPTLLCGGPGRVFLCRGVRWLGSFRARCKMCGPLRFHVRVSSHGRLACSRWRKGSLPISRTSALR